MFKQFTIAVAAMGLAVTSTSAIAAGIVADPVPAPAKAKPSADDPKTRYCIKSPAVTGTMIERKTCKTLEEWRAIGVDPSKSRKN